MDAKTEILQLVSNLEAESSDSSFNNIVANSPLGTRETVSVVQELFYEGKLDLVDGQFYRPWNEKK